MPTDSPLAEFYAADDEVMSALANKDLAAYTRASAKLEAALSKIKPTREND